jgi:hypothetical protein
MVAALNSLDVSEINPDDGLDDNERALLKSQADALESQRPELGSGGPCEQAFTSLPEDQKAAVIARVDPKIALVLGLSARSTFSSVASSIN